MPLSASTALHTVLLARTQQAIALLLLLLLTACNGGNSGLPDPPATPPTITVQPTHRSTNEGDSVTFLVQATGSGTLSYQWLRDDVEIPGATLSNYSLGNPALSDNGSLWKVRISNAGGTVTSTTVLLTVNAASSGLPVINIAPQSQTVSAGTTVNFTVDASDATGYQWQRNGIDIAGATSASFSLAPAEESDSGTAWRVIVSNASGSVTSTHATLTVTPGSTSAPMINAHPSSQTVIEGSAVTFSVSASGSPAPTFQWQRDGGDIPGATHASFTLNSAQAADNGSTWRVIVTNSVDSVTSTSATLTVQPPPPASTAVISVLAGALTQIGTADGTPGRFAIPVGLGVDSSGNVYVSDLPSHTVRRISPSGAVLTLAGLADSDGNVDDNGSLARFSLPAGVAVDATGNIYVSDIGNHNIRKITPAGLVTTLAGSTEGFADDEVDDGISTAQFKTPWWIAVDTSGNVYVADTNNHVIRKITSAGLVTTLAGSAGSPGSTDDTGNAARFRNPHGIAMGSDGNLYVADQGNNTIRKVTPAGVVETLAGLAGNVGSADGVGSAARFKTPTGISADDSGNLYVADLDNNLIRKITSGGTVTTIAGTLGSTSVTTGTGGTLNRPMGIALGSGGVLYTVGDNAVLRITP